MAVGKSNRVVVELPAGLKDRLYSVLRSRGQTLREWFVSKAHSEISTEQQQRQRKAASRKLRN